MHSQYIPIMAVLVCMCCKQLEEIEFFAETELNLGDEKLGLFLLETIAAIGQQCSNVDNIVLRAKETISKYHSSNEN